MYWSRHVSWEKRSIYLGAGPNKTRWRAGKKFSFLFIGLEQVDRSSKHFLYSPTAVNNDYWYRKVNTDAENNIWLVLHAARNVRLRNRNEMSLRRDARLRGGWLDRLHLRTPERTGATIDGVDPRLPFKCRICLKTARMKLNWHP